LPVQADQVYKSYDQALAEILAAWVARIPDINTSPDTIVYLWSSVLANSAEGFYLAMQLLHDDQFIQTASQLALQREGEQYGRSQKAGTLASGTVRFAGAGGAFIATGSQVGAPRPALNDTLVFETADDATIPDPGTPTAPSAAAGSAGNLTGTIEWAVTFTTAAGETEVGAASNTLVVSSKQVDLTAIPTGGDGTLHRKIYRRSNGGDWKFVHEIADNTTTTYTDNVADGSLGGAPPAESTAEQVSVAAVATETGVDYNVATGAISTLVAVDADVTSVTNAAPFTGGEDGESIEEFRQKLLEWVRAPQSGSPVDLVAWATSIDGVDSATIFKNEDLSGTPALGTVSIRIAGPDGAIPDAGTITAVEDYIASKDLANITILVGTFTATTVAVDVTLTLESGFSLSDVEDSVVQAACDYVNSIPPGGTVYVAGLYDAIFGLAGVTTLVVTAPASNTAIADDHKAVCTPSDVTVS